MNPFDTSFGFSNAAIGSFSNFVQASKYVEGTFKYDNREAYVQDNWKSEASWTIDYGVRFVHAVPQHDALLQSGNFLPDKWVQSASPVALRAWLRRQHGDVRGLEPFGEEPANGPAPRRRTRSLADRHARAELGPGEERSVPVREGDCGHDVSLPEAECRTAVRHGLRLERRPDASCCAASFGIYFDRPRGGNAQALVGNTFVSTLQTLRYSQLQSLGGLAHPVTGAAHGLPVQQQAADRDGVEHRRRRC